MKYICRVICVALSAVVLLCVSACSDSSNNTASIDPELVEAYYVYAQKLIEKQDLDTAIKTLEDGVEDTGSQKLKDLLESAKAQAALTTATVKKTIPTALPITTTTEPATTIIKTKGTTTATQAVSTTVAKATGGIVGNFTCTDTTQFAEQYTPTLYLYANSTFRFRVNLGDKMGTAKGSFAVRDKTLTILIQEHDYDGYTGDNVVSAAFRVKDENTLVYKGETIGMIGKRIKFEKQIEE